VTVNLPQQEPHTVNVPVTVQGQKQEPQVINVAAPNVNVAAPNVNVAAPNVTVEAVMPAISETKITGMPSRKTTSTIERDKNGNILRTTQTETDF